MVVMENVDIPAVQRHELNTKANVQLGGYRMDRHCSTNEFRCYLAQLERADEDRLFLLGLDEFTSQTRGRSCRLQDVLPTASAIQRVSSFVEAGVDLRSRSDLALILVTTNLHSAPLIIIDGNHRAIAQFLVYGTVQGAPTFVCVHQAISQWHFVPRLARSTAD